MTTLDGRRAGRWLPWLPSVAATVATLFALHAGWRLSELDMHYPPGDGPWSPGDGGRGGRGHDMMGDLRPLTVPGGVAILVTGIGLLLMRRWRRSGFAVVCVGLVVYGALGGPGPAMLIPLAFGALFLITGLGFRTSVPWLAAVPVVLWSAWWDVAGLGLGRPEMWVSLISGAVWVLLPALIAQLVIGRREVAARSRAEELERVAHAERLRVVRDIHDVVGHSLSMITLQSGVALRVLDANPEQARASLEAIRSSSKEALDEVRHTLGIFRADTGPLTPTSGLSDIGRLVEDVRRTGVDVQLAPLPDPDGVPAAVGTVAFRVVQEALTNVLRHAPGHMAEVSLSSLDRALMVTVTDHGARPPVRVVEGGGLRGMRERVEALGGHLRLAPVANGMQVTAVIPLPEGEQR